MRDEEYEVLAEEPTTEERVEGKTPVSDGDTSSVSSGTYSASSRTKYVLLGVIVVLSAVLAYGIAQTNANADDQSEGEYVSAQGGEQGTGECAGGACADCESAEGAGNAPIVAGMFLEDDHQWIDVNVSDEYFDPNVIVAAAGMPIKINFGQGAGCMAEVMFYDFPVHEDLTVGGAVVELPALEAGEYSFACGAEAVFGVLVVQ